MTLPPRPDVLIVGGGAIGCAVARAVAGEGRSVLLLDRGALGGEATGAAAGVLAVASGDDDGVRLELRRESLARWPALVETLADETGVDVRFEAAGVLELCLDAPGEAERRRACRRAQGFDAEWLDAPALQRVSPMASPAAAGGVLFPGDARVSPARLVEALAAAARRRGAVLVPGAEVRAIESRDGRVVRVAVAGEWLAPGAVVLAAGAWSGRIAGLPLPREITPARGQMLALRPPGPVGGPTLSQGGGYLVPQPAGEVLIGATVERAGFERAVTPAGVAELLAHVGRLAPVALGWPVVRMWAGLRPEAPAGGPWIGRHPGLANLIVATGHHRNGILLAPVTADAVAALLDGAPPPAPTAPFGVT